MRALPNGKTPYEMVTGKKPNLASVQEWGTKVCVHDMSGTKLDGCSQVGFWVGFDEPSNGHHIYWREHRAVTVERSVKFDKHKVLVPISAPIEGEQDNVVSQDDNQHTSQDSDMKATDTIPSPIANPDHLGANFEPTPSKTSKGHSRRVHKPSTYVKDLQSGKFLTTRLPSAPKVPQGLQIPEEEEDKGAVAIERDVGIGGLEYAMAAAMAEAEAYEPRTVEEAKRRSDWPRWKEVIDKELGMLKAAGTWVLMERPNHGLNIIASQWVFCIKRNSASKIEKYKARLVAKGFTQIYSVDYWEMFSPVAKFPTLRLLLAIAARNSWLIKIFDFQSAYFNGELDPDEVIFMEQPPGFVEGNPREMVVRL